MENNNNDTNTTLVDNVNNIVHPPNLVGVQNNIRKPGNVVFVDSLDIINVHVLKLLIMVSFINIFDR